ncbi:MAG: hypothetical protein RL220_1504 [Bacteroidota bacterium]|jgi:hypothetical protein
MKKFYLTMMCLSLFVWTSAQVNVTFEVDLNGATPSDNGVHIAGNFNDVNYDGTPENAAYTNWSPSAIAMSDDDMDGVYSVTLQLIAERYEFKFINGNDWPQEEDVPNACQVEVNGNGNREIWVGDADITYHVEFASCGPVGTKTVRFRVDLSQEAAISPDGIHVAGEFQGWDPGATAMTEKAPGVYEVYYTFDPSVIPNGTDLEYKFINGDDWTENSIIETIGGDCSAGNGNRLAILTETNTVLDAYCFNACSPCVLPTMVTFMVNMSLETVSPNGVHVAGSFQGWSPGDANYELTDGDADGIYELTVAIQPGTYNYKFINGNDWNGADNDNESLPAECNVGGNREIIVEGETMTVEYCYNQCTAECIANPDPADITFLVNTAEMDPAPTAMFLIGNFTDPQWQGGAVTMTDDDADMVYTCTVNVSGPAEIQYKFVRDDVDVSANEENPGLAECGVANGIGGYNRVHVRSGQPETIAVVCFDACEDCNVSVADQTIVEELNVFPVPATDNLNIQFNSANSQMIRVNLINAVGQTVVSENLGRISGQQVTVLPVGSLSTGVYNLVLISEFGTQSRMIEIR